MSCQIPHNSLHCHTVLCFESGQESSRNNKIRTKKGKAPYHLLRGGRAPDPRYLCSCEDNTETGETAERKSFLTLKLKSQPVSALPAWAVMSISGPVHPMQLHRAPSWTWKQFCTAGGNESLLSPWILSPFFLTVTEEPEPFSSTNFPPHSYLTAPLSR